MGQHDRGFSLTELLVALAIFVLILALLGFPLYAAFGYIQKAIAQSEAQSAGRRAVQQLSREISNASEVYPLPPTGEWVAMLNADNSAVAQELAGSSAVSVRLVKYMRLLDFPWRYDASLQRWLLLQPNSSATADMRYAPFHAAFYQSVNTGVGFNPYIVGRYEESNLNQADAEAYARDGSYPMSRNDYTALAGDATTDHRHQTLLRRKFRNDVNAITPLGPEWDVSQFKATPQRQMTEVLQNASTTGVCMEVTARYPLIAGRNQDIDAIDDSAQALLQQTLYHIASLPLATDLAADFPLYPYRHNPFGYRVRVYDQQGGTVYGVYADMTAVVSQVVCRRHYMDWPAIDRPGPAQYHAKRLQARQLYRPVDQGRGAAAPGREAGLRAAHADVAVDVNVRCGQRLLCRRVADAVQRHAAGRPERLGPQQKRDVSGHPGTADSVVERHRYADVYTGCQQYPASQRILLPRPGENHCRQSHRLFLSDEPVGRRMDGDDSRHRPTLPVFDLRPTAD